LPVVVLDVVFVLPSASVPARLRPWLRLLVSDSDFSAAADFARREEGARGQLVQRALTQIESENQRAEAERLRIQAETAVDEQRRQQADAGQIDAPAALAHFLLRLAEGDEEAELSGARSDAAADGDSVGASDGQSGGVLAASSPQAPLPSSCVANGDEQGRAAVVADAAPGAAGSMADVARAVLAPAPTLRAQSEVTLRALLAGARQSLLSRATAARSAGDVNAEAEFSALYARLVDQTVATDQRQQGNGGNGECAR
jgi:hypothetical protein